MCSFPYQSHSWQGNCPTCPLRSCAAVASICFLHLVTVGNVLPADFCSRAARFSSPSDPSAQAKWTVVPVREVHAVYIARDHTRRVGRASPTVLPRVDCGWMAWGIRLIRLRRFLSFTGNRSMRIYISTGYVCCRRALFRKKVEIIGTSSVTLYIVYRHYGFIIVLDIVHICCRSAGPIFLSLTFPRLVVIGLQRAGLARK